MRFLKEESISQGRYRILFSIHRDAEGVVIGLFIFPLCLLFLDHALVMWLKDLLQTKPLFYAFLHVANPVIDFFGNGLTLVVLSLVVFGTGRYRNKDVGKSLLGTLVARILMVSIVRSRGATLCRR
ncbi:MAG TPA: hypothetical protein VFG09_02275 [Thermodesulfovibrionales bacterium]|nr:hypothetical protein [Thermodesulfovibrionales bacterium]